MTHEEFDAACLKADIQMKKFNGHTFMTILKTRCMYCGASPKRKGKCGHWFTTFLNKLYDVLKPASNG